MKLTPFEVALAALLSIQRQVRIRGLPIRYSRTRLFKFLFGHRTLVVRRLDSL